MEGTNSESNNPLWAVLPEKENSKEQLPVAFQDFEDKIKFFAYYLSGEDFEFNSSDWPNQIELGEKKYIVNEIRNLLIYLNASPYLIDKGLTEEERERLRIKLDENKAAQKLYEENKLRINKIAVTLDSLGKIINFLIEKTSPEISAEERESLINSFKYTLTKNVRSIWKKEDGVKLETIPKKPDDVPEDVEFNLWYGITKESDYVSLNTEKKVLFVREFLVKNCLLSLRLLQKYIDGVLDAQDDEYFSLLNDLKVISLRRIENKLKNVY